MTDEKSKMKVIMTIDKLESEVPRSIVSDLKRMRDKYIFKDINLNELKSDVKYLKSVKDIIKNKNIL